MTVIEQQHNQIYERWYSDIASIKTVHEKEMLLSKSHMDDCAHTFITTAILITMLHLVILTLVRSSFFTSKTLSSVSSSSPEHVYKAKKESMTLSYQATNLLVNLFLGCYGYIHFTTNPFTTSLSFFSNNQNHEAVAAHTIPLLSRMISHPQNAIFGCLQVGYSLWSLPMGFFVVSESYTMIIHHISTLITSILSSLFLPGFRIYAPFFFGLIELSSVPLSMMNYLKDHYEWTMVHVPTTYKIIRLTFAFTFLILRVVLWIPQIFPVLKALAFFAYTCTDPTLLLTIYIFWFTILILTLLQLYWGWLVVKSLVSVLFLKKTNKKDKKS